MGMIHVTVSLRAGEKSRKRYEADFLVDTGATDSMAPANGLEKAGIKRRGRMAYELADGTTVEYDFGLVEIEFMGELTSGRVIFGPDACEPLLGVTALESVGILVDPTNRSLKRLPAVPLKVLRVSDVEVALPRNELAEALAAENRADLLVGGLMDHSSEMVTLLRGNMETLAVPFSAFPTSGDGIVPDFDDFAVTDCGQSVRFGEYEAASDAILDEYSPEYRQRRLNERRAAERTR